MKDEFLIGRTDRYIVLPQTYAVWDTQTNCWVSGTSSTEKIIVHESCNKFNAFNNNADENKST